MLRILIVALVLVLIARPAMAQGCRPYVDVANLLKTLYGEAPIGRFFSRNNLTFEVWVNETKRTATVLRILPSGCTAPIAGGGSWHVPVVRPEDDDV
jgi:hypothetical protein